ncbi:serine/threonine-protein phosphatase 7 long form [Capsicum galapagoense]
MIERWKPETHTFHLPFGEATMTLQDTQILFGLRVEGNVVVYANLMHHNFDWAMLMQVHTGFTPAPGDLEGTSHLKISVLVEYIRQQVVLHPITDYTPDDRVQRIAQLYMLLILGAILFPITSGNVLNLRFLHFVVDLDQTGTYIWGSTVLAYHYWSLCQISISGKKVEGLIPLLQIWTWERVLPFQPIPVEDIDKDEPLMPYGRK